MYMQNRETATGRRLSGTGDRATVHAGAHGPEMVGELRVALRDLVTLWLVAEIVGRDGGRFASPRAVYVSPRRS